MQAQPPYPNPPTGLPRVPVINRYTPTWRSNNIEWVYVGALDSRRIMVSHTNPKPQGDHVTPNAWSWDVYEAAAITGYFLKTQSPGFSGFYQWAPENDRHDLASGRAAAYVLALEKLNEDVRGNSNIMIDALQAHRTARIHKDVNVAIRAFAQVEERLDDRLKRVPKKDRPELLRLLRRFGPAGRKIRIVDRTLRAAFRDISSLWLTWIYGVKPTLQSIHDAVTFTREHYATKGFIFRGRKGIRTFTNRSGVWPTAYDNFYLASISNRRCQLLVTLCIPDLLETQVSRLAQLSPSVLAWELLPFSFVYDWFQNVAGYLSDTETACTYSSYFKRGTRTDSWRDDVFLSPRDSPQYYAVYGRYPYDKSPSHARWKGMSRTILSSYPVPTWPKFQPKLGAQRLFTAATLVGAFLDRKKLRGAMDLYGR